MTALVINLVEERRRRKREARQRRAMDNALRQARQENPDADFHALITSAVVKLLDHPDFVGEFGEVA